MKKVLLLAVSALCACKSGTRSYAGQVESRSELVGGPRAVGEVGDWRISNGRVRFIVQDKGASRVYTTFGGSLIDADLQRSNETDPYGHPIGHDGLGELFPAFFLSAVEPTKIAVLDDGSSGAPAHLRVTGKASEFLTSTRFIDDATIGPGVSFAIDYMLGPDDDFLTITSSVINERTSSHTFPVKTFPIPMGFIGLFGDGQPLFLPGEAGYDIRFSLEKVYKRTYALPSFPGLTTDVVSVEGNGVSYGLSYCPSCPSPFPSGLPPSDGFVWHHRDQYEPYATITPQSMLVPFVTGTLFGLFMGEAPASLPGGAAFSTTMKLQVSDGSPSRVIDPVVRNNATTQLVTGIVREERSEEPVAGADVVIFKSLAAGVMGAAETSARTDAQGRFTAIVEIGNHIAVARKASRPNSPLVEFLVPIDLKQFGSNSVYIEPHVGRAALLAVEVSDQTGRRVPAKITVEGGFDLKNVGRDPKDFLYDYRIGDPYRPTDLVPGSNRYIETTFRAGADGRASGEVRPGRYRIYVSRGPAYSIDVHDVELSAGELTRVGARVERVLPDDGRISADLHVHGQGSVDSDVKWDDRARDYAAEGIDFMAMTEHNYVHDLQPEIDRLGLTDFVRATVGLELSSLEAGHWNAYPLSYDAGAVTHGSFPWFRRTPQALFDDLRSHGKYGPDDVIVQVNHPRDAIQGYFNAYGLSGDALSGIPLLDAPGKAGTFAPSGLGFEAGSFSLDFDAIELLTGKRFDLLDTYRVPNPPPPEPHPPACKNNPSDPKDCMGLPGTVVRDGNGAVAYPGALQDWEHLLDLGHRITAVANSDSHKSLDGEGGYPRNYIDLGHPVGSARQIDEREVVHAIKAGRVIASTAPMITLTAVTDTGEVPAGSVVTPAADGSVKVHVVVDAAPWVDVTHVELLVPASPGCFRGDETCSRMTIPLEPLPPGEVPVRRLDVTMRIGVPGRDTWIAAQVKGDRSLWPVVIPYEIPTLLLTDAVGTVGAAVGLPDEFGNLKPIQKTQTFPWALSNPILIDGNQDGKWGVAAQRGPVARAQLDGSGDDAQLLNLREAVRAVQRGLR